MFDEISLFNGLAFPYKDDVQNFQLDLVNERILLIVKGLDGRDLELYLEELQPEDLETLSVAKSLAKALQLIHGKEYKSKDLCVINGNTYMFWGWEEGVNRNNEPGIALIYLDDPHDYALQLEGLAEYLLTKRD